jgi:hypothetical protein
VSGAHIGVASHRVVSMPKAAASAIPANRAHLE